MRLVGILLILAALSSIAVAQSIGGMSGLGPLVSKSTSTGGGGGGACLPGASNGQMDFSVCSNVAITAALW